MALYKVTYTDLVTVIWAQNLNDIQDAIIALEEWQSEAGADIPQILANIAPSFSNSTSYSAGDCVIVLNKLYQFTADHPAGNWTGTDATEVNVTSLLKEAVASLSGEVDDLNSAINDKAPVIIDTASGSIASFSDGADNIPVKDLTVGIEPVQSGSGDPSPSNIRPISGWTGANIHVSPTADAQDGTAYSITFPTSAGTVYGGTLDVTTGKLTVDRAVHTYDGAFAEGWAADTSRPNRFSCTDTRIVSSGVYTDNISNYLPSSEWGTTNYTFALRANGTVYVRLNGNAAQMTVDEFKAYLAANPLTVCYKLATPVVYDLAPTEVTTLLGTNNIWADCGDSTVEYRADTKLYINKKNYVTYRQFGAKLDGVSNDSAAVIAAHTFANEHGLPVVESGGSLYLNFSVNVKTSCFLDLDMIMDENSASNAYVIIPDESKTVSFSGSIASGNFGVVAPVSDLYGTSAKVTLNNANWDLGVRSGTPSDAVHYYHSQLLAYDEQGNVISSGLYTENTGDFVFSNVHSLATKSIEFSGANVITKFTNNGVGFKTLVRCIRNNTVIKNITVRNDGTTPNAQINNGGSIILLRDCANVTVENVNGFNNSVYPYPSASSTFSPCSYVYDVYDCFNTTFRNMDLSKGWGAGATHFVDNTYFVNCNISRIDNHYGCFGNFVIRDCSFNGLSIVNLGYGDANVVIDGCRFYQGSREPSAVTTRTDFTHRFCGKLAIKNTIIQCSSSSTPIYFYPNVTDTGNFPTNQADISIESTKHLIPDNTSVAVYTYQIRFANTDNRKQTVTISDSYVHGVSMQYNGTLIMSNCRVTKANIFASNFFITNSVLKLASGFPAVSQVNSGCGMVSNCLIQGESPTFQIRQTNAASLMISGCTFYGSYDEGYPFVRAWASTIFDNCHMGVALTIDPTGGTPIMTNININSALSNLSVDSLLE